jgi:serine/threonine-protein kinase HipA
MGVDGADMDLLRESELTPLVEALERASPRLKSTGLKTFNDLLGRELEAVAGLLDLKTAIEPRDYLPSEGV